jgi:hypothetical protein
MRDITLKHRARVSESRFRRGCTRQINLGWPVVVKAVPKVHILPMVAEPAVELSDELTALIRRAEIATAQARILITENDRWRETVQQQFDYMFELGAEFRRCRRTPQP